MNEDLIFFVSLAVVAVAMLYTGRAAERRVRDYRAKRRSGGVAQPLGPRPPKLEVRR